MDGQVAMGDIGIENTLFLPFHPSHDLNSFKRIASAHLVNYILSCNSEICTAFSYAAAFILCCMYQVLASACLLYCKKG